MDMQKIVGEIGLLEAGINLSKVCGSHDVLHTVGASMPLPDENIADDVPKIAAWLHGFGKKKYLFLTPEIALIEEMSKCADPAEEIIIAVPYSLEPEAKERLRNNLPGGIKVTILEEPYFPQEFFPSNSLIVVCGYSAGGRTMVLSDIYRMVEHYKGFLGKKVFVPFKKLDAAIRYDGWMEVSF